jgi:hypothetical protein
MGADRSWDAIVFGEVVFPEGGLEKWEEEVAVRLERMAEFELAKDEEMLRVVFSTRAVAVRAWLLAESFQTWCQPLEALFSAAARAGGRGEVTFAGIGEGPAYRLDLDGGRALLTRVAAPGWEHATVQEVALAVDLKHEKRVAAKLEAAQEKAPALAAASQSSGR